MHRAERRNHLSSTQVAELTGRSRGIETAFLKSLWERFDANTKLKQIIEFGEPIPRVAVHHVGGRGSGIILIDNSDGLVNRLAAAIKAKKNGPDEHKESVPKPKATESFKKPLPKEKKDTSPDGAHTKNRTGFGGRGKDKKSGGE